MEFTWEYIATVVGAGAVTTLIIQMVKSIAGVDINKWWLRLITYIVGVVLLLLGSWFTVGVDLSTALLCVLNGVAVFFAATGEYHAVVKEAKELVDRIKAGT